MNESYTRAPHRRPSQPSGPSPNAALLIDFDNVTMAMRSNLGQELRNFLNSDIVRGKVSVQRAYADWRRYPQYIVPLSEASIDLIFAPAYGSSKKNATDIRLAIDALELVFTRPEIGTYILLSGDSDFSSLVLKLKEFGKYVIGVGLQESTSDLLVQNCDEYYSYNSLSGLTSAEDLDTSSLGPWELVEEAVRRMDDRNDVMRSDRLKQVMLEIDSGFDEKDHGFNKFNRFLAEASSRGLVRLRKIGDGHYEVAPVRREEEPEEPPAPPQPIETEGAGRDEAPAEPTRSREAPASGDGGRGDGGGGGRGRRKERGAERSGRHGGGDREAGVAAGSLRRAYELLADVVDDLSDDGDAVRDSEIKREILRRDGSFDEAELGFSKFSRFLRQAYDEGVVELTTDPDGNFHLQPAGAEPVTFEEPEDADEATGQPAPPAGQGDGAAAPRAEPAGEDAGGDAKRARAGSGPDTEEASGRETAQAAPDAGADEGAGGPAGDGEPGRSGGEDSRRRRGGLGRFRSGSRSPSKESGGGDGGTGIGVGPVDEGGGDGAPSGPTDDEEPDAERTSASGGGAGERRRRSGGLGRFRRGQKRSKDDGGGASGSDGEEGAGRATPGPVDAGDTGGASDDAGAQPADEGDGDGAAGARADVSVDEAGAPEAPIPEEASDDPVGYMVGNYPGVGRKTAEKLLEAFGDSLFEVIDRDPGRLTEVLPEHRAHAVVDAREAERERQAS